MHDRILELNSHIDPTLPPQKEAKPKEEEFQKENEDSEVFVQTPDDLGFEDSPELRQSVRDAFERAMDKLPAA